jgi:ABC-type sugar transport system ATPase subunit
MSFLEVRNLGRQLRSEWVVKDVSFELPKGQRLAIAGETGSGKTSLLKMIGGLAQAHAGEVRFEGRRVLGPEEQLLPGHKGIAYLGQHFELRNNYRVIEELDCTNRLEAAEAIRLYEICQVRHLLNRRTNELSGGERQRIALAKQLAMSPRLLLLDEPFSNLDRPHKNTIKKVLHNVGEQLHITTILVSHEPADLLSWADEIFMMQTGLLVQQGPPQQVYHEPLNEYCASLLGDYSLIDADIFGLSAPGDKRLFLRPEAVRLCAANANRPSGLVTKQLFYGAYYLHEININEQVLLVNTGNQALPEGDTVYLSLATNAVHWL